PALAAARVQRALRLVRLPRALALLELRVAPAALDHLPRLLSREHAQALLDELEPHLPPEALVLLLLGGDVGLAACEVAQPRADARGQLRVAGVGATGLRGLEHLEPAVDVLAIELEAHGLDHPVDVGGIEGQRQRGCFGHGVAILSPSSPDTGLRPKTSARS